jgi:hypothetical protein
MPSNSWQVGVQYDKKWNNVNWSQPGGPLTPVYPQEITGNSNLFTTEAFNELTGVYMGNCNHSFNYCLVIQDWDYLTGMSVALICCSLCSCVQRTIEPFSEAVLNPLQNAILYP